MKKIILLVALILAIASPAYARGFSGGFHSSFSGSHSSFSGSHSSFSSGSRSSSSRSSGGFKSFFGGSKSSSSSKPKVSLSKSSSTSSKTTSNTYRSGKSRFSGGSASHVVYSRTGRATSYSYYGHSYHYSYYSPYHSHFWSFQSGLMWGSLWHPFGGVYGYGASQAYYPPSAGVGIIDFIAYLIGLLIILWVIKVIFFRRKVSRW